MTDDRYDDGLVHGHAWATEPPAHIAGSPMRSAQPANPAPSPVQEEPFDDGLVHPHGWASTERGRPAAAR
jgi:hypothetical protein